LNHFSKHRVERGPLSCLTSNQPTWFWGTGGPNQTSLYLAITVRYGLRPLLAPPLRLLSRPTLGPTRVKSGMETVRATINKPERCGEGRSACKPSKLRCPGSLSSLPARRWTWCGRVRVATLLCVRAERAPSGSSVHCDSACHNCNASSGRSSSSHHPIPLPSPPAHPPKTCGTRDSNHASGSLLPRPLTALWTVMCRRAPPRSASEALLKSHAMAKIDEAGRLG